MIVCDTPVKISVHKSCKLGIIDYLQKEGFPVSAARNDDICIDPKKATNLPYFGLLLEAIISSCNNPKKNFIHVANVGIRIPIQAVIAPSDLTNPECSIDRLFSDIKTLRSCNETTVEILQLDIAFTLPHPKGEFMTVHASKVANDENTNPTLLNKSKVVIFPMYTHTYDAGPNGKNKTKNGTVLIKTKKKSNAITTLVGSECYNHYHPDHIFIFEKIKTSDTTEPDTKENVEMYTNNLYSLKLYSNHIHSLGLTKGSLPRKQHNMHYLPDRTVRQLTSMLNAVSNTFNNTVQYTNSVGIGLRSEVSIRPVIETNELSLRLNGHLNDFLMIAYFSLLDVYRGAYRVVKTTVSIEHTKTRLMMLIEQLRPLLRLRASRPFNLAYPKESMSLWLQAQIGQIMNLAGFAQLFYHDPVIKWLKSNTCYDPSGDKKNHNTPNPEVENIMESCLESNLQTREAELKSLLQQLKSLLEDYGVSKNDTTYILTYVYRGEDSLSCFTKLSYQGKLQFLSISEIIIPLIANSESRNDSMDKVENSGQAKAGGEIERECNEDDMEIEEDFQSMDPEYLPEKEYDFVVLQPNSTERTTMNPYTQIIHSIDQLNEHTFFGSPAFNRYLFTFIIKCHQENLAIPCQSTHTTNPRQLPEIDRECMHILKQESQISLQQLRDICRFLSVPIIGINLKTELLIKALSTHYLFPCSGVAYNTTNLQSDCSYFERANLFLNEILNSDVVITMPGPSPISHETFHRPREKKTISILRKEYLATTDGPNFPSEVNNDTKYGYESLAPYLNHNSSVLLRQTILNYMEDNVCFDHSFLLDNGSKNPAFEKMTNLGEIERKHNIFIEWPICCSPDNIEKYKSFAPDVIYPLISLIYEIDITFYDLHQQNTKMYIFIPSKKSILYTFESTNFSPTIDTTIAIHHGNCQYSYQSKLTRTTQTKNTSRFLSHHHLSPRKSQNTMATVHFLNKHTWKRSPCKTETMTETLIKAMRDIEYNFRDYSKNEVLDNDMFHLQAFLTEFSYTKAEWVHLMKTLYWHDMTQYNIQSRLRIQEFIDSVISPNEQTNHALLCPIFSLKFKISVTIWDSNKPISTHHYSYCNRNSAIKYSTCQGYQQYSVHNWGQRLYITIGKKKQSNRYGYYSSPTTDSIAEFHPQPWYDVSSSSRASPPHQARVDYNHIRKLNLAYSPSNETFRSLVLNSFKEKLRMQVHEFDELAAHVPESVDLNKKQIVAVHNILDNKKSDCSCLISFPSQCNSTKCIAFVISGAHEDCRKKALRSSIEALRILSGQNDLTENYGEIVHLTYPKVPLLGGFIFLVHMFIAQECNSPDQFQVSIDQFHREKDLLGKVKLWTTKYLYNGIHNPMWLNNILPMNNRKHGKYKDDHGNIGLSWQK